MGNIDIPRKGVISIDQLKNNIDWIVWIIFFRDFFWYLKAFIFRIGIVSWVPIVAGDLCRLILEFCVGIE
jgi:hypothetical protein